MGKKVAGLKAKQASCKDKVAEEEVSLKKVDCDWSKSSVRAQDLEDLREKGLLPPLEELKTHAPGKDVIPCPRDGERVCFVDFLPRGFAFPMHSFLRGLFYVYAFSASPAYLCCASASLGSNPTGCCGRRSSM